MICKSMINEVSAGCVLENTMGAMKDPSHVHHMPFLQIRWMALISAGGSVK